MIGDVDLCFLEEWSRELDESIDGHLRDVLAVQPKTLVEIESSIAPIDFFELEKLYHFIDVDLFAIVFRRPAEEAKIIAHGFGGIALLDISGDARARIALAHLRTVAIQDQRDMRKMRRGGAERSIKLDMFGRV